MQTQLSTPTTPPAARELGADYHPATSQAYRLGVLDAKLDELCVAEMYFRNPQDKLQYTMGYESVKGPTLLSNQAMGRKIVFARESNHQ